MKPFKSKVTINGITKVVDIDQEGRSPWLKPEDFNLKVFPKGMSILSVPEEVEIPEAMKEHLSSVLVQDCNDLTMAFSEFEIPTNCKPVIFSTGK